jgi:hypothetical protein
VWSTNFYERAFSPKLKQENTCVSVTIFLISSDFRKRNSHIFFDGWWVLCYSTFSCNDNKGSVGRKLYYLTQTKFQIMRLSLNGLSRRRWFIVKRNICGKFLQAGMYANHAVFRTSCSRRNLLFTCCLISHLKKILFSCDSKLHIFY